jgi:STE24 endopeptidase
VLAAAWGGAAALLLRTRVPADLVLPKLDVAAEFDAATLARIEGFRRVTRTLWALFVAVELLVLILLVRHAGAVAGRLGRLARGRVRTAVGMGLAAVLLVWLAQLPLGAVAHWWRRRYGLSEQGYGGWAKDAALSLGVRAVLVALAVAGAVALAARFGRRWPLAGAPALVAVGAAFLVAQPLLLQPLFNRFEPLADRPLAREVQRLGAEMGVDVTTVQVADASRRTTTANAYVAGLGPTRRVVFYDTALDGRFDDDELAALAAHELAHVERRHLWKGLAWFVLLAVPGLVLVAVVTERRGGLRDPALVPLGLLLVVALTLATLPVQSALSRRYEAEADWLALVATDDPVSVAALERRFAVTSLADPDPPGWARVLLSTHPPTVDRIAMARAFAARADGSTMAP